MKKKKKKAENERGGEKKNKKKKEKEWSVSVRRCARLYVLKFSATIVQALVEEQHVKKSTHPHDSVLISRIGMLFREYLTHF